MWLELIDKMWVVYREMSCDGANSNAEYNSSTLKLPDIHVMQMIEYALIELWMFFFHGMWWNVSFWACTLWEKEQEKHILT